MSAFLDIWNTIVHIVTTTDKITLALLVVAALAAGLLVQEMGAILTTTIIALVAFAVLNFIRAIALQGASASTLAPAQWHSFLGLQMQIVLAYAIIAAVLVFIAGTVRNIVTR